MEHDTNKADLVSRFFLTNDFKSQKFVFDLPASWWSRPYEYAWAANFAGREDVALDAGSGISHPFKFFLASVCNEVCACDLDSRILSTKEIIKEVKDVFGENAAAGLSRSNIDKVNCVKSSVLSLPYSDKKFDKIYCISVMEHMNDFFNRHRNIQALEPVIGNFFAHDICSSIAEFRRVLKDDGLIILTFDYPRINLDHFKKIVSRLGLSFAGDLSFKISKTSLYSKEHDLYCYRAVLKRAIPA